MNRLSFWRLTFCRATCASRRATCASRRATCAFTACTSRRAFSRRTTCASRVRSFATCRRNATVLILRTRRTFVVQNNGIAFIIHIYTVDASHQRIPRIRKHLVVAKLILRGIRMIRRQKIGLPHNKVFQLPAKIPQGKHLFIVQRNIGILLTIFTFLLKRFVKHRIKKGKRTLFSIWRYPRTPLFRKRRVKLTEHAMRKRAFCQRIQRSIQRRYAQAIVNKPLKGALQIRFNCGSRKVRVTLIARIHCTRNIYALLIR